MTFEFQYSDRLGYIACSPQNLGTGLYSSITIELPELGLQEDSLKVVCENIGLRAVNMSSVLYACAQCEEDEEDGESEMEKETMHREWVEEDCEEEDRCEERGGGRRGRRGRRGSGASAASGGMGGQQGEETKEADDQGGDDDRGEGRGCTDYMNIDHVIL